MILVLHVASRYAHHAHLLAHHHALQDAHHHAHLAHLHATHAAIKLEGIRRLQAGALAPLAFVARIYILATSI